MPSEDRHDMFSNVLLPVASEGDARHVAGVLAPYRPKNVTALLVDQQAGGSGIETASDDEGGGVSGAIRDAFPDAAVETLFSENVVDMILHKARDIDASAIVFGTGANGRVRRFFSGDRVRELATRAERPVVALPE